MRPLCLALPSLLFLLACSLPGAAAPAQPSNLSPDILYTTKGEFVQVSPMRPLTLNAHVQQFAYDPLGVEVAYVGSEVQGDQTVYSVKTMDTRTGHEMSRLSVTAPTGGISAGFNLLGWSRSGKSVLLVRFSADPTEPTTAIEEYLRWDLGANPPMTRLIDPAAHLPSGTPGTIDEGLAYPSPDHRWIMFKLYYHPADAEGKPGPARSAFVLYDPDQNTYRPLTLPADTTANDWSDDNHLIIRQKEVQQRFDVVTGQISPLGAAAMSDAPAASKQFPDLTLDVEHRTQEDVKGSGGHLDSCLLWVRRMPAGKLPLGAAAAGLTPSRDDPQAVWSPTGKQIAFIAHGDLYVTDVTPAIGRLPNEKLALGLALTCAEERQLAEANLKQIGLGLIQYAQDHNEHFPPTEGVNDAVYPYLKTRDVFQVGGHRFVYQLPSGTSLAKIDSPAGTPEGTIDLPCARVVLFADGHVKTFMKEAPAP